MTAMMTPLGTPPASQLILDGKEAIYGKEATNPGLPHGSWLCDCRNASFRSPNVPSCHVCGCLRPVYPAEKARAALADALAPVAGWDDAAFEAPRLNPWPGLESILQAHCDLDLRRRGITALHIPPTERCRIGWPDIVFAVKGVPFAIELKNATGKPSAAQRETLIAMRRDGWQAWIVRSLDALRWVIDSCTNKRLQGE